MAEKSLIGKFILRDRTDAESGYTAPNMDNENLIGREGVTITPLHPAGSMKMGEERIDVVSEGDFIEAGVLCKIVAIDGTRNIVRPVIR